MSDEAAIEFLVSTVHAFREHAMAVVHPDVFIAKGGQWTPDGVMLEYIMEPGATLASGLLRDVVVELLARTYKLRTARAVDWQVPMPPEDFQDVLEARYPVYRGSGLELNAGWFDLLSAVAEWRDELGGDFYPFVQTKEKFGGLRLYGLQSGSAIEISDAAEFLSFFICDICGKQGNRTSDAGWLATRCDEHRHV